MDSGLDRASEESETPQTQKTRQERIRENQRRSRARRQEYLQDLERKISDCHVACREADMQKEMFWRVQMENARLRELLALAGVSPETIDGYLTRGEQLMLREGDPGLRTLRPKYPMADDTQSLTELSQVRSNSVISISGPNSGPGLGPGPGPQSESVTVPVVFTTPVAGLFSSPDPGNYGYVSTFETTATNVNMSGIPDHQTNASSHTVLYDAGTGAVKGHAQDLNWIEQQTYSNGAQFYQPAPGI